MICNNSRADVFERCPREYFWNYEFQGCGLVGFYTESFFADGLSAHAGLGVLYSGGDLPAVDEAIEDEYSKLAQRTEEGEGFDFERCNWNKRLISAYVHRAEPVDDFEVMEVETDFNVPLNDQCTRCSSPIDRTYADSYCPNCTASIHRWVGRTDLTVMRNGGVAVLDHKTTKGTANTAYIASFDHSWQLIGYAFGVGKQNDVRVGSYGVNVLKKLEKLEPYPVTCTNCKGTGQLKTRACSKCIGQGTVIKEPGQLFIRKWFQMTPDKKAKFIATRTNTLNEIENNRRFFATGDPKIMADCWPMRAKQCHMMRSGGACKYADLCWSPTLPAYEWWEPSSALLSSKYVFREADYVTIAEEDTD